MFRELLGPIEGVGGYKIAAMLLFLAVFIGVIIRTWRMDRRDIDEFSALPLEDNDGQPLTPIEGESNRG